ncbi:MAG TPA: Hsp20/alpha crystallin family protein [Miltoncostaeaceae bacterium]|nr:Hsp20/alpha crystallin family protein [Miltoncostaeaceae bacterium]
MPTLVRFDPLRDITVFRSELDRVFGRAFGDVPRTRAWSPAIDLVETADAIVLKADLPGLGKDDVDVEVDDNVLTISGERRFTETVEEGRFSRIERAYGTFSRSITLPQGVKSDQIAATFRDGVLEVTVPKAEEVRPRKVSIEAGPAE